MKPIVEALITKHQAIATTLFGASVLGSFYYTVRYGRSAFVDAQTLITGNDDPLANKASHTYQMRFR